MMFKIKYIGITIVLHMLVIIDANPAFHNDMPDLRDVMRKEDIQDEFNDYGTFEHQNPISSQNEIIQRNAIVQPQSVMPTLHTFKKEYPVQYTPQATVPSQPVRPQRPNKLELVIQPEESELKKSEKANEAFEKLLQFMTILSQVDEYLRERTQSTLKAIGKIAEEASNNDRKQLK